MRRVAAALAVSESAIVLLVGLMILGYWADKWLGSSPWLFLVSTVLGLSASMYRLIRSASKLK